MKPYFLAFGSLCLVACLTKDNTEAPIAGDLWVYDSSRSTPRWPDKALLFKVSDDTLDIFDLSWSAESMWKVKECYRRGRRMEIDRSGDTIELVNTTDSIWRGPTKFHANSAGELQGESSDTNYVKLLFNRVRNYADCDELFSRDFKFVIRRVSTEDELYTSRRFDLALDYSLDGTGYGYSGYSILIEGGPTLLGSYLKYGKYFDSTVASNQGSIDLSIPLDSLYDSLAENIRLEINLAGRVSEGREIFFGKKILYPIKEM